jgi:arylsulfatase A-like enzyme
MSTMRAKRIMISGGLLLAMITAVGQDILKSVSNIDHPNVIIVMTDDQGYGELACHGNPYLKTPNIDAFYEQSVRMTDFHVSPICSPTRAALLSGREAIRTGTWRPANGVSLLRADLKTMADIFRDNGYLTGIFNKWHLGDNYPFRPQDRGFQESFIQQSGGIGQINDYWGNNCFDDTYLLNGKPTSLNGYNTDGFFDAAMKFIASNKNRPFFVFLPTTAPHGPLNVPPQYVEPYKQMGLDDREAHKFGMISNIDENMGRLTSFLERLNLEENTILIFLTDNGSSSSTRGGVFNAGMRGGKGSVYDGGHRVPFFIRFPAAGILGGKDLDYLTDHIDVFPTLIDLCGLEKSEDIKLDGRSMAGLLRGSSTIWPERSLFVHRWYGPFPTKWGAEGKMGVAMQGKWRLVNNTELYNIQEDPSQQNNIADNHPDIVVKLRQAYDTWWEDVSQDFKHSHIIIGSDLENPSKMTAFDWHGDFVSGQKDVRQGVKTNGYWLVEVERSGTYRFELRRYPKEVNKPIRAALPAIASRPGELHNYHVKPGQPIIANHARLKIADEDVTKSIPENAVAATFEIQLKAGKTRLQTWFMDDKTEESSGAYYVYVERFGDNDIKIIER